MPVSPPQSWAEAKEKVLPRIRRRSSWSLAQLSAEVRGRKHDAIYDRWQPFQLSKSHPGYARFCKLRIGALEKVYAEQKTLLDELAKKQESQTFAALFNVVELSGVPQSFSAWTHGRSLLPRTDLVFIVVSAPGEAQKSIQVRWEDLEKHAGHLMKRREGLCPPRYEVGSPPDEEVLTKLRPLSLGLL